MTPYLVALLTVFFHRYYIIFYLINKNVKKFNYISYHHKVVRNHLYLRPGVDILNQFKGLHNFMDWDGAILTDSGGFQIYSLKGLRKIQSDGATFQSHLDGSKHYFTPEKIIDIQQSIGSPEGCIDFG